jgi:hypothetical protein
MLANLPAKRATRKIISLKDGFNTPRKKQVKTTKTSKFKCGKLIHGKAKEQNKVAKSEYKKTNKNQKKKQSIFGFLFFFFFFFLLWKKKKEGETPVKYHNPHCLFTY